MIKRVYWYANFSFEVFVTTADTSYQVEDCEYKIYGIHILSIFVVKV